MITKRSFEALFTPRRLYRRLGSCFGHNYLAVLTGLCLFATQVALSQERDNALEQKAPLVTTAPAETRTWIAQKTHGKEPVESEISETAMTTYGNYRIFGAAPRCNIWTAGVEYDRHSWGHFLKAQIDYVVEILPFVVLSEPAEADFWGNPRSPKQQLVYGVGLSPFGFRFLWRGNKMVKPFMTGKAGVIAFPKKIISPNATYENFNFQGDFGVQIRMTERVDLRVEPVVYFHVSNGYLAASNPGFDELGAKFGISYHLGKEGR